MPAELAFSASDLALVRFAVSPMWEVGTSFKLLFSGAAHPVHRPWAEQVRPRVVAAGLEHGWLAELVPRSGYVPDFLNPAPVSPAPTLAQELAVITTTPTDRIRADLDRLRHEQGSLGPRARSLHAAPPSRPGPPAGRTPMARLAEEIETYWELALAPFWARLRAVLDAEVFQRARQVAEYGTGHLLNDLHPSVSWDDNALRLASRRRALSRRTAGAGLLLIPSAFTGEHLLTRVTHPEPPQLAYQARGIGSLWQTRPAPRTAAVAAVLGRSRTRLLTELESPASTTDLAHRTGLSPATVSQCLTALRDAGLVSTHRAGRSLLYARTAAADCLLAAAGPSHPTTVLA
ncbi:winged helix-turn-helix domain-containing protein [Kitasatospora sp. NBC_01287]|uniref:ArsR/SmtB family transcription factor n=1 Tax=Kitasatospora sp. NBC_01287 TaxID=2903573 RepID=UPI0022518B35|nr:helix-turn-helix domain-containing protein [Kitasatospora sp. NBC_01287]MCX4745597.1 winged helix-turn-helix domain-containing protein [Kitasatospora sp. NBC_01287]